MIKLTPLIALLPLTATGSVTLIDFSDVIGSSTHNGTWNIVNQTTVTNQPLVDFTGSPTGQTVSTVGFSNHRTGIPGDWSGGSGGWVDSNAGTDLFTATSASQTVSLRGLANGPWKLEIVSGRQFASVSSTLSANGAPATGTGSGAPVSDPWVQQTDDWLVWDTVTPIGGTIDIVITRRGVFSGINALRLSPIPEPHSTALAGLGGLMLLHRRKRA